MEKTARYTPLAIMSTQYFLYFGTLGIFLPYFNLYCHHIGLTGFEIGSLSAVRSVTFALFPLLWGTLADRLGNRRFLYIFCNVTSMFVWTLFFFTDSFWPMLIITAFYGFFFSPIISFLETTTLETLAQGKRNYGRIRVWGSISFIIAVISIGKLTDYFSIRLILYGIGLGTLLQSGFSIRIPKTEVLPPHLKGKKSPPMFTRNLLIFLICGFLMLVSHGTYYGFFSIHLEALGCSKTFIGISWAIAVIAEIVVMINSERLFRHMALETVLFYSFIIAAGRWLLLFLFESPLVIIAGQLTHAFTYGSFHMASILYMDRLSPDKAKTTGQSIYNAVTYGLGLMTGFFLSGALFTPLGAQTLFLMSAGIALAGGILFRFGRLSEARPC
jgi:MFS transporter, PPP family, 3-phenylpropionic acid transporter